MSASVEGGCVPTEQVPAIWPAVAGFIAAACARGGAADADQIKHELLTGKALLWIASEGTRVAGAGATQLWRRGDQKVCSIVAWSGRGFAAHRHIFDAVETYARRAGCAVIEVCGRYGWTRMLAGFALVKIIEGDTPRQRRVILERKI